MTSSTSTSNFYPRPPRGGRPGPAASNRVPSVISIHALREEGDLPPCDACSLALFLSTPSARRATLATFSIRPAYGRFLSTPSARRATQQGPGALHGVLRISIHALREEGDAFPASTFAVWPLFLSTPSARRATAIDVSGQIGRQISIHALREEGDLTSMVSGYVEPLISIHTLREEGDVSPESLSAAS